MIVKSVADIRNTLTATLRMLVSYQVFDPTLLGLVQQAAEDPTRFEDALSKLASEINLARSVILFPGQSTARSTPLADCYRSGPGNRPEAVPGNTVYWQRIVSDAGNLALWIQEAFERAPKDRSALARFERRMRAGQVTKALRIMLLARLYALRANVNDNVAYSSSYTEEPIDNPFAWRRGLIQKFRAMIRDYNAQVRKWKLDRALSPGQREASDSIALNSWQREFGHAVESEVGWSPFATDLGIEMRYQRHLSGLAERRSQIWLGRQPPQNVGQVMGAVMTAPVRLLATLVLTAFMITTGFGLRPRRFAATVASTILAFSGLYYYNSLFLGDCGETLSFPSYGHALYQAIANLTNIGANPRPCGPLTDVLTSIESLSGYFLLSVLAAMLFIWLSDR